MILLIIIFALLVVVYIARKSNNDDLVKKNAKYQEELQIIKERKKKEYKGKVFIVLSVASIVLLIAFILCDFTSIDYIVADYMSAEIVQEQEFERLFYFIPAFIMVTNLIYAEVNIGDFILRYFKTKEEEVEININKEKIMSLLYKKKPTTEEEKKSEK